MTSPSAVRIAVLFPEMLGTYGDGGNATALAFRLRARGLAVELVPVPAADPVPVDCDVYLLGGSEDGPQEYAAGRLADGRLHRAVEHGAAVVAVCSGLQLLGRAFPGRDDRPTPGLGLLPLVTEPPAAGTARTVGDVVVRTGPDPDAGTVVGFENHRGQTLLDAGATALGTVTVGIGNHQRLARDRRVDGCVAGRVLGTYLHGPVLALNPLLADTVLGWVTGPLAALEDDEHDAQVRRARQRRLRGAGQPHETFPDGPDVGAPAPGTARRRPQVRVQVGG